MTGSPEMRGPARALESALDRAEGISNDASFTIAKPEPETNFAALYLTPRYGLADLPSARTVAALANFGRALL